MTATDQTGTGERIVVIPEVTMPATAAAAKERVFELVDDLMPRLEALRSEIERCRDARDEILVAIYPAFGPDIIEEVSEVVDKLAGWDDVYTAVARIGDMFGQDHGSVLWGGLQRHEIARGERDFPRGTIATVGRSDGGGEPIRVEVEWGPLHPLAAGAYVVCKVESGERFSCSHDEIKAGL